MALESATYLDDLVVSNPAASDTVGQADDHIRLLKSVLQATFPNIDGEVTATPLMLNSGTVPTGLIGMWSGDPASLPTNWKLCDGTTVARSDGTGNITLPDLRGLFIIASGASNAAPTTAPNVGNIGGTYTHNHVVNVGNTALTQAQLPNYSLTVSDPGHTHTVTDGGHAHGYSRSAQQTVLTGSVGVTLYATVTGSSTDVATTGVTVNSAYTGVSVTSGGSGAVHGHTGSSDDEYHLPPYYTLAFIMKI